MRINTNVMAEEKTILLKVELDVAQLKKNAQEAEKQLKTLVPAMEKIKKEQGQHSIEYKKVRQEVTMYNKVLTDSVKALTLNEKTTQDNTGSINDMRAQLAAATVQYNSLTKEQRENADVGGKLQTEIKGISDALKDQEGAIGDNRRNVGNYAGALSELKAELKAMKGEMVGLDADSERYQELAEKAGVLGDKIKEVNENVKASSGGTGFEKLSNNLGLVGDDLMNLDFAGVNEKMAQMALISKNMTFKETLGGLKNMVGGLLNLGKAIMMNPLFLLAGVIIGVGAALKEWVSISDQKALKAQERFTASLERQTEAYAKQAQAIRDNGDLRLRMAEAQGADEESLHKIRLQTIDKANQKEVEQLASLNKERLNALQENRKAQAEFQKFFTIGDEEALKKQFESSSERYKAKSKEYSDLKYQLDISLKERAVLVVEFDAQQSKAQDDKAKEDADKAKQRNADVLARQKEVAQKLRELALDNIDLTIDNQRAAIEAHYQYLETLNQDNNDILIQLAGEKNSEISAIEEAELKASINRINVKYNEEVKEAGKNKALISELTKQKNLEIEALEKEMASTQKQRDLDLKLYSEKLEKEKIRNQKTIKQEIELIDAEINYNKKKGTADEFSAWSDYQFAKIRQLETLSALEIENANLTADEKIKIEKETALAIQKINAEQFTQTQAQTTEQETWTKEQKQDTAISIINATQQLSDTLFQIGQNQIQAELNEEQSKYDAKTEMLQNQLDSGLISQAEFNAQKSALESAYNAKEKALKEEQFRKAKTAQLISATIAAAVGVANALNAPPPASFIMAGIAGALGAAQVALIASQPTPKFEKGGEPLKSGIFGGKPHLNGGTKGVFEDGTQIEVEKDEAFFVLNKRSSMIPALSDLNVRGGGVPFMEKGGVLKFAAGGAFASSVSKPVQDRFEFQNQMIEVVKALPAGRVLVEDIISAQGNLVSVTERANY